MSRLEVNGIQLNVEVSGDGPPLLLLHGFTGDLTTWDPFLDAWSGFQLVRVDIIGHGRSDAPADLERYSMHHAVEDLIAVLEQLGIEKAAVLGYSMGGRVALHLALAAPERLWALVLESASPGIADAKEREARVASDNSLADSLEQDGLEAFVDHWQTQPLFASQANLPPEVFERQRRQRLASNPLGLVNSLRGMGAGRQEYLLQRLDQLKIPAMFLAGALDERYAGLAHEMASLVAGAEVEIIDNSGHAAHLEQPEAFARVVASFLAQLGARSSKLDNNKEVSAR